MSLPNILNIIFPSHCLNCENIISKNSLFCNKCWPQLKFIKDPKCPICSFPFEIDVPDMQPFCGKCVAKKPSFDKSIIIYHYNYMIKKIISDLKYRDNSFLVKKISQMLLPSLKEEITQNDILASIPLHPNKLKKRKFNQTHQICQELIKKLPQKPIFYHDLIFRVNDTKPQIQLRGLERQKNLKKAFMVNKKYQDIIGNKRVFLLDDVITTGATMENCAKAIKKKKPSQICVISLAKTVF